MLRGFRSGLVGLVPFYAGIQNLLGNAVSYRYAVHSHPVHDAYIVVVSVILQHVRELDLCLLFNSVK